MGIKRLCCIALTVVVLAGIFVFESVASVGQEPSPQSAACTPGELVERRTRDSKTFQKADCSFSTEFGSLLHYRDEAGRWEDVDLRFRSQGEGFVMDRHNLVVESRGANLEITERGSGEGIRWLTPVVPEVAGRNASFSNGGLRWTYATRKSGLKLSAVVDEARGPRTYEFRYQLLGGAAGLSVDEGGNLVSSSFVVPHATALGADLELYEAGEWELLPGQRVAFTFDDSILPGEAFPYELDPTTTFNVNVGADDGTVHGYSYSYPPPGGSSADLTGPYVTAGRTYQWWMSPPTYSTWNAVMRWNTSSLPDGAVLRSTNLLVNKWYSPIYDSTTYDQDKRNLTADWHEAGGITTSSFSKDAQTSALAAVPLWLFGNNVDYSIRLDNTNGVSKTGYTGLRLHVSGGQPTGMNHVYFSAYDDTSYAEPRLIVEYDLPTSPSLSSVSDSPDPVSAGNTTTFTLAWSDPNPGDSVRGLICKTPSVTPTGLCAEGGWAAGNYTTSSPATVSYRTWPENVGTNNYYAFACDASGGCSSPLHGTFTVTNSAPSVTSVTDSPDPATVGSAVNFSVGWTDPNSNDSVRAIICKTNAVSGGSCPGGAWATGSSSSTSPATASFTSSSSNTGTHSYYAFVCDRSNACSGSLSGTFTVKAPNSAPNITSISDSPDPAKVGQSIVFNVGWSDPDSGDSVRAVICESNGIGGGVCTGGGLASGNPSQSSPSSATYTPTASKIGTNTYYAFACDSSNACSSATSGTFVVNGAPSITSASDSPDPAEVGDSIIFNVGWTDPNAGDSVRAVICETNSVSGGVCNGGGLASGHPSQSSPSSATYATNTFKTGTHTYYAFACDSSNECSPSRSGTFTVNNTPAPFVNPTMSGPSGQFDADGYPVVRDGNTLTFSGAITQGAGGPPDSAASVTRCDLVVRNTSGVIVNRIAVPASSCRNSNGTLQGSYAPGNLGTFEGSVVLEVEVTRNSKSSGVRQSNPLQVDNAVPVLSAATIGCYSDVGGASCQDRRTLVVDFSEPVKGGFMTADFSVSSNSVLSVGSECSSSRFCDEVTLTLGMAVDEANPPDVSYTFAGMMGRSRPVDAMGFALPNAFNRSRSVGSPPNVDQPADVYAPQPTQTELDPSPDGLVQIVDSNVLQAVDAGKRGVTASCPREFQTDPNTSPAQVRCDPEGRAIRFAQRIVALANKGSGTDHDGMPYAPDVVLLQEVRTRDAREIAGHLNSRVELDDESCTEAPRCYRVAISYESSDGDVTWDTTETRKVVADTAILYNQRSLTLPAQSTGGFNTAYSRDEKCVPDHDKNGQVVFVDADLDGLNDCGKRRKVKRHFMAKFVEAPTGSPAQPTDLEVAVASIHFTIRKNLRNQATHALVKDRWAQKAANRLRMFASSAQLFVLGGDFNIGRCGDEDLIVDDPTMPPPPEPTDPIQCQERDWWKNLTGHMHLYDDSLYVRNRTPEQMRRQYQSGTAPTERRIDFIFVRNTSLTEPTGASRNFTCGLSDGSEDRFRTCNYLPNAERYSDHLLQWSLAGP